MKKIKLSLLHYFNKKTYELDAAAYYLNLFFRQSNLNIKIDFNVNDFSDDDFRHFVINASITSSYYSIINIEVFKSVISAKDDYDDVMVTQEKCFDMAYQVLNILETELYKFYIQDFFEEEVEINQSKSFIKANPERTSSVLSKLDKELKKAKKFRVKFKTNQFDVLSWCWIIDDKVVSTMLYPPSSINITVATFDGIIKALENANDRSMYILNNSSAKSILREFNKVDTYEDVDKYIFLKSLIQKKRP